MKCVMESPTPFRLGHPKLSDGPAPVGQTALGRTRPHRAKGTAWNTLKHPVTSGFHVIHEEQQLSGREDVNTSFGVPRAAGGEDGVPPGLCLNRGRAKSRGEGPALPWYSIPSSSVEDLFGLDKCHASRDATMGMEKASLTWDRRREQRRNETLKHVYQEENGGFSRLRTSPVLFAEGCRRRFSRLDQPPPCLFNMIKDTESVTVFERPASHQLSPEWSGERESRQMRRCFDTSPSLASVPTTAEFLTPLGVRWGARQQPPFPTVDGLGPNSKRTSVSLGAKRQETAHCARADGDWTADTRLDRLQRLSIASESLFTVFNEASMDSKERSNIQNFERSNGRPNTPFPSHASKGEAPCQREVGGVYFNETELVEAAALLAQVVRDNAAGAEHFAHWRETLESVREGASEVLGSSTVRHSRDGFDDRGQKYKTDDMRTREVMEKKDVGARGIGPAKETSTQWTLRLQQAFENDTSEENIQEKNGAALMESIVRRLIELVEQIVLHPHLLSTSEGYHGDSHSFSSRLLQLLRYVTIGTTGSISNEGVFMSVFCCPDMRCVRLMQRMPLEQKEMTLMCLECWMCIEKALESGRRRKRLSRIGTERVLRKRWDRNRQSISRCSTTSSKTQFQHSGAVERGHGQTGTHVREAEERLPDRNEKGSLGARAPLGKKKTDTSGSLEHGWSVGWTLRGSGDSFSGHVNRDNTTRGHLKFQHSGSSSSSIGSETSELGGSLLSYEDLSEASSTEIAEQFHEPLKTFSLRSDSSFSARSLPLSGTHSYARNHEHQYATHGATAKKGLLESDYGSASSASSGSSDHTSSRTGDERMSMVPRLALGDVGAGSWLGGEKTSGETYVPYQHAASNAKIDTGSPHGLTE